MTLRSSTFERDVWKKTIFNVQYLHTDLVWLNFEGTFFSIEYISGNASDRLLFHRLILFFFVLKYVAD